MDDQNKHKFTKATIPKEIIVMGRDVRHTRANFHPFTRAKVRLAINATWKCRNMGTFSPKPSSSLLMSLILKLHYFRLIY